MLIRFATKNFKSFRDISALSMVKASNSSELSHHIYDCDNKSRQKYLKAAVILGANASGKSNLIKALEFAIDLIKQPSKEAPNLPVFKMNEKSKDFETEFEFDVLVDGVSYWYSFALIDNYISYEILKKIEFSGVETEIYSRDKNSYSFNDEFWGVDAVNVLRPITKIIQKHNLFLSELRARETKLSGLINWFSSKVVFLNHKELNKHLSNIKHNYSDAELSKLSEYIRIADVGISEIKVIDNNALLETYFQTLRQTMKAEELERYESIKNYLKESEGKKIQITHTSNEASVEFDFDEESTGTQKYLKLLPILLKLGGNYTYICDELETSLHPMLTQYFLSSFFEENKKFLSQLIFTTHEHTLLDLKIFRRDEIWFAQKNRDHSSSIYSLDEFKERNDTNLPKNYFDGRFGGIPIIKKANTKDKSSEV